MSDTSCCGPGYASPSDAIKAPSEKLLYTIAIYTGTGIQRPDYLATIDVDPDSPNYSKVIHRLEMPGIGDELHHMGWNACSSCHGDVGMSRKYLLVPGVRSNNIHIIDTATDPFAPRIHKIIKGSEIKSKTVKGHKTVRFVQYPNDKKGIIPNILMNLLKQPKYMSYIIRLKVFLILVIIIWMIKNINLWKKNVLKFLQQY